MLDTVYLEVAAAMFTGLGSGVWSNYRCRAWRQKRGWRRKRGEVLKGKGEKEAGGEGKRNKKGKKGRRRN